MYQIAIIDDDPLFCERFKECLETVVKRLNIECSIFVWYKGSDFEEWLADKKRVDLLFLDVELGESYGVDIGKFIREELVNYQIQLVYISHEQGHAMELFDTEPMDFLVKPISKETLDNVMQRFMKKQICMGKVFNFKEEYGDARISYDAIMYFQSMDHKVIIHTAEGQKEFYGKLTEVESKVPDYFWRIHKSFLVNEHYVGRFYYDKVVLRNGQKLTISKPYRNVIRDRVVELI